MPLCAATTPAPHEYGVWYCTRPRGHGGDHIATVGPYEPALRVLARWPQGRTGGAVLAHLRACAVCQSWKWCKAASRLGLTREERDATIAFDRALNPDEYPRADGT